ncbi:BatD family protein [Chitinophaga horti]|uniref:BatD family protein n=1 Tax=Chitinophaga horti TaxID=2920382 RepID=A0ABY6J3G7_9BACT|nr:BatD family protein [Chitinophaga horti]UYQ92732.1 BatD family protein [Chitinophaga horti]
MIYMIRIAKKGILTLLVCCTAIVAMAQEFRFITQVSSTTVTTDDYVQIQFVLENATNLSQVAPPDFKDFDVVQGPMQSTSTSIVNGKRSEMVALIYLLRPKRVGNFTIAGAVARVDGVNRRSNPVTIEVTKGAGSNRNNLPQPQQQPQQPNYGRRPAVGADDSPSILRKGENVDEKLRKNIFVKVEVDKTNVYEGEQVTATYKLYTRLNTSSNVTKVPAFKGFSAKDVELPNPPQASVETVNGLQFKVFTIRKTMLFPLQSGTLELDPAEVDNQVRLLKLGPNTRRNQQLDDPMYRDVFGNSPFDDPFFDDFFNRPEVTYEDVPYKIKSNPVTVTVKPLPAANRPASFSGAVGHFEMNAVADKKSLSTDDAVTVKVTITGQGNVNLMRAPEVSVPDAFETFDPKVTDNIDKNSNPLSGSRTFEYIFMPREAGNQTLPGVEFSYFDPKAGEYKVLRSTDFPLAVSAGKNANREKQDYSNLGRNDLSTIYPTVKGWVKQAPYLFGKPLFWALLALPLLTYGGVAFYRRNKAYRASNAGVLKHKNANKVALKRLELAARYLKEEKDKAFYEETSRAVWGYLSHKLRIPMAELSKQLVQEKLQDKVEDANTRELFELLDNCELALYAPVGSSQSRQHTYRQAIDVISKLEDDLKKVIA